MVKGPRFLNVCILLSILVVVCGFDHRAKTQKYVSDVQSYIARWCFVLCVARSAFSYTCISCAYRVAVSLN